jgi:broad specificity phosphatase PhoE
VSTLLLIRHGQASLGAADYDVLSPLGIVQSGRVGDYLARMIATPTAIYHGPLRRQRDTAAHIITAARAAGVDYPAPQGLPGLDEYPAIAVMQRHLRRLADDDADLQSHLDGLLTHERGSRDHRRAFEAAFQTVMRHWHDDRLGDPEIEAHAVFQARVERTLLDLLATHGRGATILAVTSAGVIGVALKLGLLADSWTGLKASFVIANASLTELKSRGDSPTLTMFNALPHLHDRSEISLR